VVTIPGAVLGIFISVGQSKG